MVGQPDDIAFAQDLERTLTSPICLLTRDGSTVRRKDIWPDDSHLGLPIIKHPRARLDQIESEARGQAPKLARSVRDQCDRMSFCASPR